MYVAINVIIAVTVSVRMKVTATDIIATELELQSSDVLISVTYNKPHVIKNYII